VAQAARVAGTRIAIAVWDGVEELDFVGPFEVLTAWNGYSERDIEVAIVAESADVVRCAHGLRVLPDVTWDELERPDVLVVPGGGRTPHHETGALVDNVRKLSTNGTLMTSVCTGALAYANAGLLEGKPATTHWGALEELASFDGVEVRPDERFVDAGEVVTAQGVSAGIDMALYLITRLDSAEVAAKVRRYIQYDPKPPV
jgi:transcriptional regulator GlxA family with amidase domain